MGQTETSAASEEEVKWRLYDIDFSVHKSRRYHQKLWAFYSAWRDWMKIVTVVAGSSAFVLVFVDFKSAAELVTGFVSLWAVLDLITTPDKKAEVHSDLYKRFTLLAKDIEKEKAVTIEACKRLAASKLDLEEAEPPCKRLVDLQARNDECRAREFPPEYLVPLDWWQLHLGYFLTFGMRRLEQWKADHQRG